MDVEFKRDPASEMASNLILRVDMYMDQLVETDPSGPIAAVQHVEVFEQGLGNLRFDCVLDSIGDRDKLERVKDTLQGLNIVGESRISFESEIGYEEDSGEGAFDVVSMIIGEFDSLERCHSLATMLPYEED